MFAHRQTKSELLQQSVCEMESNLRPFLAVRSVVVRYLSCFASEKVFKMFSSFLFIMHSQFQKELTSSTSGLGREIISAIRIDFLQYQFGTELLNGRCK